MAVLQKDAPKKIKKTDRILSSLRRFGMFHAARRLAPNVLTVLNYHRIDGSSGHDFSFYRPNISADPLHFSKQMDYVKQNYDVISCAHLAAWLRGEFALKPNSALITFDDGYYDNLSNACPVLYERGLPATIFLTTDYIGTKKIFYWDYTAYCFYHTRKTSALLPVTGKVSWTDEHSRDHVMNRWINFIKRLPDMDKQAAVEKISEALEVVVPPGAFDHLCLTWDQVRELTTKGIEMGAHTASHPILTRISLSQAADELSSSKRKIESEIGKQVIGFAYPNGQETDLSPEIVELVKKTGYEVAFSLLPGPTRYDTVRKNPFAIRRVFIGHSDTFSRFAAKLLGFEIFAGKIKGYLK